MTKLCYMNMGPETLYFYVRIYFLESMSCSNSSLLKSSCHENVNNPNEMATCFQLESVRPCKDVLQWLQRESFSFVDLSHHFYHVSVLVINRDEVKSLYIPYYKIIIKIYTWILQGWRKNKFNSLVYNSQGSQTDRLKYEGKMWLALGSVKSNRVAFLNPIC